ncbi:MAG: LysR family transcriptional regulator [Paraburkholderia sp.]|uniref:LysR family transcriptional regulator n=1 Tax=Paraburkholderia sp. TaxID=1926495 RepID=UPI001205ADA8|nr:LysR family transcriptional regulator [Paraburkholderia sp.]TAL98664.1 MAG: LysR family transcriptional regulator [Paraburkholderia sp.]
MDSMDPKALLLFAKVVECSGISNAARMLSVPKATISRAISRLEASLGTRLLERTSRQMRLTESGETIYGHCQRIAEEIEEAKAAVGSIQGVTRGKLRLASPLTFGRSLLSPALPKFLARYPELHIELELTNRRVDPVEENFDVVIRLGPLADTSLIAKKLGVVEFAPCASPAYLNAKTKPKHPHDLSRHAIIDFFGGAERHNWIFSRSGEKVEAEVVPSFDVNDPIVRRDAAVAGLGVALLPLFLVREEIEKGQLQVILPQWQSTRTNGIYALYPNRRSLSLKSRAFLAFLEEEMPSRLAGELPPEMPIPAKRR